MRSHAPQDAILSEKQIESDIEPSRRILHRRATLPKLTGVEDEHTHFDRRQSILDDGQVIDPADIGFAVTSGSNFLKRRSRSAGALHALSQVQTRPSPIPWKQERRRSDEIRYWRASVTASPATNDPQQTFSNNHGQPAIANPTHETTCLSEAQSVDHDTSRPEDSNSIPGRISDTGKSFHFGGLTVTVDDGGEKGSIEERVVSLEVKLIDLEYTVSRLQSSSTTGQSESSTYMLGHESTTLSNQSHHNSDAATNLSVSTQPTTVSLFSPLDEHAAQQKQHAEVDDVIRGPLRVSTSTGSRPRNSLDTLTIDHLNSLIGLIRREQAARHRLEDQVVELQREFKSLRLQLLPSSGPSTPYATPYAAHSGWSHTQPGRIFDDSETDDGFQEIYETPTEFTGRGVYEGGVMVGRGEGIAF